MAIHQRRSRCLLLASALLWLTQSGVEIHAFAGAPVPRAKIGRSSRPAMVPGTPGAGGKMQALFMGKRVDWKPMLGEASKAVEVGGEMPLGVRFEQRSDGAFIITEIISGGAASVGELDVQVGNIIHAVSCTVGGKKAVTTADEVDSIDQMTQAILSNSDERVQMLVEKPDEGAVGAVSFLTDVATRL
mmetsp:Transcript_42151/g.78374  ORF Transcript_42151/g.78374 Transcript_42151/m.78374 type:complete len:188 (-) Transcript_42151:273-836(-)